MADSRVPNDEPNRPHPGPGRASITGWIAGPESGADAKRSMSQSRWRALGLCFRLGPALLFISQTVTGVVLALYYAPTADHAHTTVAYIMKEVTAGSFRAACMPMARAQS